MTGIKPLKEQHFIIYKIPLLVNKNLQFIDSLKKIVKMSNIKLCQKGGWESLSLSNNHEE